jgi:FkbM family methyltransferase
MWKLLQYLPPSFLTFVKHNTSGQFRYLLRQQLGAKSQDIPEIVYSSKDGRKFEIGPDDAYWGIYYGLGYEPEVTNILSCLVKPDDVILDVGTNFGWYTTLFAQIAGDRGKIHSFEPSPTTYEKLLKNIELNNLVDFVIANRCAVSDSEGSTKIHVFTKRSHGCASLSTLGEEEYEAFDTPLTTLNRYIADCSIERVDFLKIDVEGSELAVLKGASDLLSSPAAPPMMIEINDDTSTAFGYDSGDIWELLCSYGYDHFYAMTSGEKLDRIHDVSEFKRLADVHMVHALDEKIESTEKSIFARFKGVPGMAIVGKGNIVTQRLQNTSVKVFDS